MLLDSFTKNSHQEMKYCLILILICIQLAMAFRRADSVFLENILNMDGSGATCNSISFGTDEAVKMYRTLAPIDNQSAVRIDGGIFQVSGKSLLLTT